MRKLFLIFDQNILIYRKREFLTDTMILSFLDSINIIEIY